MIYFLYGQDLYRSREELKKIIDDYKKSRFNNGGLNSDWLDFVRIDARSKDVDVLNQLRESADTISMFNQGRFVVIENIFSSNKDIQESVLEFLENRALEKDKDTILVFWDEEPDKRVALFKYLSKSAQAKEFQFLKDYKLKSWIKDYIKQQGAEAEDKAINKIIEYVGSDLWRITNEINKLILFRKQKTKSPSNRIQVEDIELLVRPEVDLNIFEMVDALGQKNKKGVLKLFKQYLEKGEDEFYLLSMFVYQFRNLIKVKSGGGKDLHPFVFRKSQQQARNFDLEELKKIYQELLMIDLNIKVGKTDSKVALELFVVNL